MLQGNVHEGMGGEDGRDRFEAGMARVLTSFAHSASWELREETTILFAECRSGRLLQCVPQLVRSSNRVIAVDARRRLVDRARQRMKELAIPDVFLAAQRPQSLPYAPGVFSLVADMLPHAYAPEVERTLRSLRRLVAPGGRMLLFVPAPSSHPILRALLDEFVRSPGGADLRADLRGALGSELDDAKTFEMIERLDLRFRSAATLGFRFSCEDREDVEVLVDETVAALIERAFAQRLDRDAARAWLHLAVGKYFEGMDFREEVLWNAWWVERPVGENS